MATLGLNLPVPAGNGAGATVDTSGLAPTRAVAIVGGFSAVLTIEAGANGVFCPVMTMTSPGTQTVIVSAPQMRVVVSGYVAGAPVVSVSADPGTITAVALALPVPNGDGTGAAVNVSSLPEVLTAFVGGAFSGAITIEVSDDAAHWSQPIPVFTGPGCKTAVSPAVWARVRRGSTNPYSIGTPSIALAGGGISTTISTLFVDTLTAEDFRDEIDVAAKYGLVGDGSNEAVKIQLAINEAPAYSTLFFRRPPVAYGTQQTFGTQRNLIIDKPLTIRGAPGTTFRLLNGGRLFTVASASVIGLGKTGEEWTMNNARDVDGSAVNAFLQGARTLVTTVAADAANFSAGDWLLLCCDVGAADTPYFFDFYKVASADPGTGIITLYGAVRLEPIAGLNWSVSNVSAYLIADVTLENVVLTSEDNPGNQLFYSNWCRNLELERITARDHGGAAVGGDGIVVQYAKGARVRECNVFNTYQGMTTSGSVDVGFYRNRIEAAKQIGFYIDEQCGFSRFVDNLVQGCKVGGLLLSRAFGCIVGRNEITANGWDVAGNTNVTIRNPFRLTFAENNLVGINIANYNNLMAFFDAPGAPAFYRTSKSLFAGNRTLGSPGTGAGNAAGARFNHWAATATTALRNVGIIGNYFDDGMNYVDVQSARLSNNQGAIVNGGNADISGGTDESWQPLP